MTRVCPDNELPVESGAPAARCLHCLGETLVVWRHLYLLSRRITCLSLAQCYCSQKLNKMPSVSHYWSFSLKSFCPVSELCVSLSISIPLELLLMDHVLCSKLYTSSLVLFQRVSLFHIPEQHSKPQGSKTPSDSTLTSTLQDLSFSIFEVYSQRTNVCQCHETLIRKHLNVAKYNKCYWKVHGLAHISIWLNLFFFKRKTPGQFLVMINCGAKIWPSTQSH